MSMEDLSMLLGLLQFLAFVDLIVEIFHMYTLLFPRYVIEVIEQDCSPGFFSQHIYYRCMEKLLTKK